MASIPPTLANRLGQPERNSTSGLTTRSNAAQPADANWWGVWWTAGVAGAVGVAAMGGYLAGRSRTKWTSVHRDEVYFHGARCARLCSEIV